MGKPTAGYFSSRLGVEDVVVLRLHALIQVVHGRREGIGGVPEQGCPDGFILVCIRVFPFADDQVVGVAVGPAVVGADVRHVSVFVPDGGRDSKSYVFGEWNVHHRVVSMPKRSIGRSQLRSEAVVERRGVGLVGNDAHDAGQGACTEECSLGTLQDLDSVNVEESEVRLGARVVAGDRNVVKVNGGRPGQVRPGITARPDAPDEKAGVQLAPLACLHHSWNGPGKVVTTLESPDSDVVAGQDVDRYRNVPEILSSLRGCDDDLLDAYAGIGCSLSGIGGRFLRRGGGSEHCRGNSRRQVSAQ